MIFIRPIHPDKLQICSTLFGVVVDSRIFARGELTLPDLLEKRIRPYLGTPRFGLLDRWRSRLRDIDASSLLHANLAAAENVRVRLYAILAPAIRIQIEYHAKAGPFHTTPLLMQRFDEFTRNLPE